MPTATASQATARQPNETNGTTGARRGALRSSGHRIDRNDRPCSVLTNPSMAFAIAAKTAASDNGRISASCIAGRNANIAPTTIGEAQTSAPAMAAMPQIQVARTRYPPGALRRANGRNVGQPWRDNCHARPTMVRSTPDMDRESELALVERVRAGDTTAFDAVHAAFNARLTAFSPAWRAAATSPRTCWRRPGCVSSRTPTQLHADTRLGPWLFTVARNVHITWCRARAVESRTAAPEPVARPRPIESPFERAAGSELDARIEARWPACRWRRRRSCCWSGRRHDAVRGRGGVRGHPKRCGSASSAPARCSPTAWPKARRGPSSAFVRCSHDSGTARPVARDARGIDGTSHDAGARHPGARALPRHHRGRQCGLVRSHGPSTGCCRWPSSSTQQSCSSKACGWRACCRKTKAGSEDPALRALRMTNAATGTKW